MDILLYLFIYLFLSSSFIEKYPSFFSNNLFFYTSLILLVISQVDQVISSALKGLQEFKISAQLEFASRLSTFVIVVILAGLFKNLSFVIFATPLLAFLVVMIRLNRLTRLLGIKFLDVKFNKRYISVFFHFGKWMTLQNIAGSIYGALDKLLLGSIFGPSIAGSYNVLISITQLSHFLMTSLTVFVMPKVSSNILNVNFLKITYYKCLKISTIIIVCSVLLLAVSYQYLAHKIFLNNLQFEYFSLLIIYGVLGMCVIPYNFVLGLGEVKILSNINTICSVFGVLTTFYFVTRYGMFGAILARAGYTLIVTSIFLLPPYLFVRLNRKKNLNKPI